MSFFFYQPTGTAVDKTASTKRDGLDPASNGEEKSGSTSDRVESALFMHIIGSHYNLHYFFGFDAQMETKR